MNGASFVQPIFGNRLHQLMRERRLHREMALVASLEVANGVLLAGHGIRDQNPSGKPRIHMRAKSACERERLGQPFTGRPLSLVQQWQAEQSQSVDTEQEPVIDDTKHGLSQGRMVGP